MEDESQEDHGLKEVPASDILARIEKGELVKYDHVIVKGDLILGNFKSSAKDDRKLVTGKIAVTDSLIQGKLDFSNVFFQDFIDFSKTRFFQEALFERAAFKCGAELLKSKV